MLLNPVSVLKNIEQYNAHFTWPRWFLNITLWAKLVFFVTCFVSYADDYKTIDEQSEILLDYAEKIITNNLTSEYSLKITRSRLVKMRGTLLENEGVQLTRVKNLTDQIKAMDSPVLDGEIISDRLKDLKERLKLDLATASFPLAFSRSARERAEQYIGKIDILLLERFKSKLLSKNPSPLYLFSWVSTISELSVISQEVMSQVTESAENLGNNVSTRIISPMLFFFLGLAFFWLKRIIRNEIEGRIKVTDSKKYEAIFSVVENLNQLILPVIGYLAICNGLKLTGIFGEFSTLIFDYTLKIILSVVVARWLILSLASQSIQVGHLFNFDEDKEKKVVRLVVQLSLSFGVILFTDMVHKGFNLSKISQGNLYFPIIVISSFTLFHLSRIIKTAENYETFAGRSVTFSKMASKTILVLTILIPAFAIVGYIEASLYLVKGIVLSLAVIAGAYVGYRIVDTIVKGVLTRDDLGDLSTFDKLLSSLIAVIIFVFAIMVITLVWGLGISNLQDIWFRINEGVSLGDSRVTPSGLAKFLVIFTFGYMLTRFLQRALREKILPSTNLDAGGKGALLSGVGYIGYFLAGILALSSTGLDLSSLAILAGALSVGLGFGMQTIVSNFVSGIIMLIERPIKEGDWIEVSGYSGTVKTISVRSTHLQTFNKATAIIPNSAIISSSVLNWMHGDVEGRVSVPIEVAYGTNPDLVKRLLLEIASAHLKVLEDPEPVVLLRGFGESALKFELRAFITEKFSLNVQSELNFEVLKVFEKHNIEIPYPKRDLNLKIDSKDPNHSKIFGKIDK